MNVPLLWLNLALATVLALIFYQPALFIPEKEADFIVIASGPRGSEAYLDAQEGADAFERDWGGVVSVVESVTEPGALARAFKNAMALQPRGISMPGHVDADLLLPLVADARRRGIIVTFHTSSLPAAVDQFRRQGTGYAGTNSEEDGALAALATLKRNAYDPEVRALVVGTLDEAVPGSRPYGCIRGVESYGGSAEYIQTLYTPESATGGIPDAALVARLAREPQVDIVFWDAGSVTSLMAAIDEASVEPEDVGVATFTPAVGLPLGHQFFIKQQYSEQGLVSAYLSLVQLYLSSTYSIPGIQVPINASL